MRRMYSKPQLLEAVEEESKLNGIKVFEDVVDNDGHKRFIEGDITLSETIPSVITKVFGKWSLSGTHLMIVLFLNVPNTTSIPNASVLATLENVPQWVKDKIVAIFGTIVEQKTINVFAPDGSSSQTISTRLRKTPENTILISTTGDFTASAERNMRASFDLLIDNN